MRDHDGDQAAHGVVSWVRMLRRRQPGRPEGARMTFPREVSHRPTPDALAWRTASHRVCLAASAFPVTIIQRANDVCVTVL